MSATRAAVLFALWIVLLPSAAPADLAIGLVAATAASWTSVRLLPRGGAPLRVLALLGYLPHFFLYSVRAAVDVALRAFRADMRLRPGYVDYRTRLPRGFARNTFATITSLMPGSVPCADRAQSLEYHCLDTDDPVAAQLREEEEALRGALGGSERA
jgi:multicomponent Na+:H+ antiporter subunit E